MRMTIWLEEHLARLVRRQAAARGLSVSAFVSRVLDDALKQPAASEPSPFRLVTVRGSRIRPGVDPDSSRSLDVEDDRARFGR